MLYHSSRFTWVSCWYYCTKQKAVGERPRIKEPHEAKHYTTTDTCKPTSATSLNFLNTCTVL